MSNTIPSSLLRFPHKSYSPNRELSSSDRRALRAKVNAASARLPVGTSQLLTNSIGGTHSLPGSKHDIEVHDLVGLLIPQHLKG